VTYEHRLVRLQVKSSQCTDHTNKGSKDIVERSSCSSASPTPISDSRCSYREWYEESEIIFTYYDFITSPPLSHLPTEDVQALERQKCFLVPVRPILDEITRVYFLYVQLHFPLLDEARFWSSYGSGHHDTPIRDRLSLFTFQAFLCVACSVCNDDSVRLLNR
jgi:hypothetical protein